MLGSGVSAYGDRTLAHATLVGLGLTIRGRSLDRPFMAGPTRNWEYHWWDPVWGACFGLVAAFFANRAGWSPRVAVSVGIFVGLLGAAITALAVWVDRRETAGNPQGPPERVLGWCSTFLQTYARANRRVLYGLVVLIVISLVWMGLTH